MGFRINITDNGTGKEYGDDHKFYGYASYEEVKESFDYLCTFIRDQWKCVDLADSNEDIYNLHFCMLPFTNSIVLDQDVFSTWAKLYIKDYRRKWKGHRHKFETYFDQLSVSISDKCLEWY